MLQYIIALIGILTFGYFIYKKPTIETYVLFVTYGLCLIDTKILPMEYGLIKFFDVVTVGALFLFFKDFISFRVSDRSRIYLVLVLLFWFFIALGKINSQFPTNNLQFIYQPFTIFIYARFLLLYIEQEKDNIYKLISAFQFSIAAMVLVIFIQVIVGPEFTYSSGFNLNVFNEETGITRYQGFFNDSQTSGQFLAMGSFSLLIFEPNITITKKRLQYFGFLLATISVFLAGSRSALGGWLIGMIFLFFFQSTKVKTSIALLGLVTLSAIIAISPKTFGLFNRVETISSDFMFRQSIWEETGGIIEQYPMLGIGFANFKKYTKSYHQDLFLEIEPGVELLYFDQPENGYLKILVEHGYIGFLIFALLIILPLTTSFKMTVYGVGKKMIYPIAAILSWAVAFNTVYTLIDYRMLIAVSTYLCLCINNNQNGGELFAINPSPNH